MLAFFLPKPIREIYFNYKDLFEECAIPYCYACSFLLMHCLGITTFCELVRTLPWSGSVSSLCKYAGQFNSNRFMRRNSKRVLDKISHSGHGEFAFVIDDTANPKYGNYFSCFNFGSSSGKYFGQKILVLAIVDLRSHKCYPLQYAFLSGKKDESHVPAPQVAINLLHEVLEFGYPPFPVVTDSWFDSKEFIQAVYDLGCDYAGELKSNRNAKSNPGPYNPIQKLKQWFKGNERMRLPQSKYQKRKEKRGKAYSENILYINGLGLPLKVIAVYRRINGSSPFAYYATTDLSMTGAQLWRMSRARWSIEVMFRDLKQSLSFGRLTAGGEGGAHLSVCLPFILYSSIQTDPVKVWEKKNIKESVGTTIKKLREQSLSKTLDHIINQPNGEKIKILKARRSNPNRKPVNFFGKRKTA